MKSSLMDLKVVGTLGLTEDDVEAIRSIDGVESAEGAYSYRCASVERTRHRRFFIWNL